METELALLAFAAVVSLGFGVQTVTGFGAVLVCVTLGSLFMELRVVLTLALPVSILQATYIAVRRRTEVQWKMLLTRILPLMVLGAVGGFVLVAPSAEGGELKRVFGALVCVLAVRELWLMHSKGAVQPANLSPVAAGIATLFAGVMHGVYGTGGPLLVYALGKTGLSKGQLRSTLSPVWLTLNCGMVAGFLLEGRYDPGTLFDLAVVTPGVLVGIVVGEWVHAKVDERTFRTGMFILLLVAAVALIVRA